MNDTQKTDLTAKNRAMLITRDIAILAFLLVSMVLAPVYIVYLSALCPPFPPVN